MTTILRNTIQKSKRVYRCDASDVWIDAALSEHDVSPDDWVIIKNAEASKWRIQIGEEYRKIVYVNEDGNIETYRARLDMDALCMRLGVFDED